MKRAPSHGHMRMARNRVQGNMRRLRVKEKTRSALNLHTQRHVTNFLQGEEENEEPESEQEEEPKKPAYVKAHSSLHMKLTLL